MRRKWAEVAYSRKSDMVRFWGDGITQPLFSTFKLIAKLESTFRLNWKETLLKEYV